MEIGRSWALKAHQSVKPAPHVYRDTTVSISGGCGDLYGSCQPHIGQLHAILVRIVPCSQTRNRARALAALNIGAFTQPQTCKFELKPSILNDYFDNLNFCSTASVTFL